MTEDDTFAVLRGLTRKEAEKMYSSLYRKFSKISKTIGEVTDKIDVIFQPYGWKCEMLDDPE